VRSARIAEIDNVRVGCVFCVTESADTVRLRIPLVAARAIYLKAGFRLTAEESQHSYAVDLVGQAYELELDSGS
jgi:hypothetical protein